MCPAGVGDSWQQVWHQQKLQGLQDAAQLPEGHPGGWNQLRDAGNNLGEHEETQVECRKPGLWQWGCSAAEDEPRHTEVCLQVQLCPDQWQAGEACGGY